MKIFEMNASLR